MVVYTYFFNKLYLLLRTCFLSSLFLNIRGDRTLEYYTSDI
ncbi:hypothetical protein PFMALIP_02763 [Plasmodium falciparum MaliPS096_E11]|uniref:Uncharacterized protein n=1 Tax=Plasmodium falciparum MaliPS096_E11 TaxID=1036727 RepID=A0A024WRV1_PLAFA|nr:hypothetical protein PFMALIP_02763 [Plasmodium falciparum MaliPS096_E11]